MFKSASESWYRFSYRAPVNKKPLFHFYEFFEELSCFIKLESIFRYEKIPTKKETENYLFIMETEIFSLFFPLLFFGN